MITQHDDEIANLKLQLTQNFEKNNLGM